MRAIVGAANLEHLPALVDADEARHAGDLAAVEKDEGAIQRRVRKPVDAAVEMLRVEGRRIDGPNFFLLGARFAEADTQGFTEGFRAAAIAAHRLAEPSKIDHSSPRSCATLSDRSRRSM